MDLQKLEKELSRVKIMLMGKPSAVFLAYAILHVPTVFSNKVATAATNGLRIEINPKFFQNLNQEERQFLLAHEVLHILLSHMTRLGTRDQKKFNIAADYVINTTLVHQGFTMINGGFYDKKYLNWSVEQVYNDLPDDTISNLSSNTSNHSEAGFGDSDIPSKLSTQDIIYADPNEAKKVAQTTQKIAIQASLQASMQGASSTVPHCVQRLLDELTKPKVNWKTVLRKYLFDLTKTDYSWRKPNRRLLTHGYYLPSLGGNCLSKISFAIDTSGSVSPRQFNEFLSEVAAVFKLLKPRELDILQFDHELQDHTTVKSLPQFTTLKFKGCGGTCPEVAVEAFMKTNSKALFVITDGYFWNKDAIPKPRQPVIWVIFDNPSFKAPFGSVIHVNST